MDRVKKGVFINGVLINVGGLDANISRTVYRGMEIEVRNVKGDILGVFNG